MIDAGLIGEIVATYKKHGWILRRVLLSAKSKAVLEASLTKLFGDVKVMDASIDAAWFSRPPKPEGVPWEIRYLGAIPFALLENLDENNLEFEAALQELESRLCESVMAKKSA